MKTFDDKMMELAGSQSAGKEKSRDKIIVRTSIIGILANVALAAFKAAIGLITGSIAITLDAVNNISDAGSSLITIIGTKLAGKQPDRQHPWGYGRLEYISAMVISIIVLYAGITSLVESVKKIIHPEAASYTMTPLIIIAVAVVVKIILGRYVKGVGVKVNSDSLINSGTDAMLDSIISASTLVAALIFIFTGLSLEAWLGAVISLIIIKSGIDMLRETLSKILGQRIDVETAKKVREVLSSMPGVLGIYDLIFHDYGPDRINCSAHAEVEDHLTAVQLDELQRSAAMKLYMETGVILTALGVYAVNTRDERINKMREDVYRVVMGHENLLEMHGFYVNEEEKRMQFDIIVGFDAKDREGMYRHIVEEIRSLYPDYQVIIVPDSDFSITE